MTRIAKQAVGSLQGLRGRKDPERNWSPCSPTPYKHFSGKIIKEESLGSKVICGVGGAWRGTGDSGCRVSRPRDSWVPTSPSAQPWILRPFAHNLQS